MQPTNLTLEERERWAYANGDVERAKLLGEALDLERDIEEMENERPCACGCED